MRRRLEIGPDGIHDITGRVGDVMFVDTETGSAWTDYQTLPTLRDDALWERFVAARDELCALEKEVCAACVEEPLDEFELERGAEQAEHTLRMYLRALEIYNFSTESETN